MFRLIGYFGGIILFLALGIKKVAGYQYFFVCSLLNIIALLLIIIFRGVAKYFNGFWRIWCKRLQRWISSALMCLGHHTELPEYQITTVTVDSYGHKNVSRSTTNHTFIWGMVQMVICAALTAIAPLVVAFVLFCYIESVYYECQFQKNMEQKNMQKQEQIARCSARMSLQVALNDNLPQNNISSFRNSLISTYPCMEPAIVKKPQRASINQSQEINNEYYLNKNNFGKINEIRRQQTELKEEKVRKNHCPQIQQIQKIQQGISPSSYNQKDSISFETKVQTKNESIDTTPINIQDEIGGIDNDQL